MRLFIYFLVQTNDEQEAGKENVQWFARWYKKFIEKHSPGQLGPLQPLYITSHSSLFSSRCRDGEFVCAVTEIWINTHMDTNGRTPVAKMSLIDFSAGSF